jgi:hypothetical protein
MDIQILTPQAGQDYPTNWNQFLDWFGTEEACLRYLRSFVGPKGSPAQAAVNWVMPTVAAAAVWSAGVAPSSPP